MRITLREKKGGIQKKKITKSDKLVFDKLIAANEKKRMTIVQIHIKDNILWTNWKRTGNDKCSVKECSKHFYHAFCKHAMKMK